MVKEKEVAEKKIFFRNEIFEMQELYKTIRKKIESLGYIFVEKAQKRKSGKYGEEVEIEFFAFNEFDPFGKGEINIKGYFERLGKVRRGREEFDCGDGKILFTGKMVLDYNNKWGRTSFGKFLFDVYTNYLIKGRIKELYKKRVWDDVEEVYGAVKGVLESHSD